MTKTSMLLLTCFVGGVLTASAALGQVRLIVDTDHTTDVDDVGALGLLHGLADTGEVEIMGVIVSDRNLDAAKAVDAVNTFYGRPNIPIGMAPSYIDPPRRSGWYNADIIANYAHDLVSPEDGIKLYRKLLAQSGDGTVTIVTLGYASTVNGLLASPGDASSTLNGNQLVSRKVKQWVAMGGRFQVGGWYKDTATFIYGNWTNDPSAIKNAVNTWPRNVPIIFSPGGWDDGTDSWTRFAWDYATGGNLCAGPHAGTCTPAVPAKHILKFAYNTFFSGPETWSTGPVHHSADLIAALVAVRGAEPYFSLETVGHQHMFDDGLHEWRRTADTDHPTADMNHSYVEPGSMTVSQVVSMMNELMVLSPGFGTLNRCDGVRGIYYNGTGFQTPITTHRIPSINMDWVKRSPYTGVRADGFSVRWEGALVPAHSSGTQAYTLKTVTNDGVTLWFNGTKVIDDFFPGPERTNTASVFLTAGKRYPIMMEFFENTNNAKAQLLWSSIGIPEEVIPQGNFRFIADQPGLYSEIYDNPDLTGLALTRIDGHINANWGTGGPPRVASDRFSVRWGGELIPAHSSGTQVYTFKATANDVVRLWIDDLLLIDQWTAIGENTYTASASLTAGRTYPIRLEYSENTGSARVVLKWSTIGLPEQVIEEPNYRSRHRDYSVDCTSGPA